MPSRWIRYSLEPLEDLPDLGPLGVVGYNDRFDENTLDFLDAPSAGLSLLAEDNQFKIIGDGTSGPYDPASYELHDADGTILVNAVGSEDKLFVRARSTVDGLPLRIDLQDNQGFVTTVAGLTNLVTNEFEVIEYNFAGNYSDGGYGGTSRWRKNFITLLLPRPRGGSIQWRNPC